MGSICLLTLVVVLFLTQYSWGEITSCKDENGNNIDWFYVYKVPRTKLSTNILARNGVAYMYMDGNNPQWELSPKAINETDHAVYFTLQQLYSKADKQNTGYILYNDEPPNNRPYSSSYGHTKGVLVFDESGGFWLVQSVPKFPPYANQSYGYPHSGQMYGQSMLCISIKFEEINNIGKQLLFNHPHMYDFNIPSHLESHVPNLVNLIHGAKQTQPPLFNVVDLSSRGGRKFVSFAKTGHFGKDLYSCLVGPKLKTSLLVETWQRRNVFPSNCTAEYQVINVRSIRLPLNDLKFTEHHDHSKWAISTSEADAWVCVGDINREHGQLKRGGGTVCTKQHSLWKTYRSSVNDMSVCEASPLTTSLPLPANIPPFNGVG